MSINKATAPYNFIQLENRVIKHSNKNTDAMSQATFGQDKLTGTIHYSVKTITPLYIGNGKNKEEAAFFTNPKGIPTIPGNTIRGLTRFNASIFSYAALVNKAIEKKDITDTRFYYREFASTDPKAKAYYKNVTGLRQQTAGTYKYNILENVRAGYMRQVGDGYTITPAIEIERANTDRKFSYIPIHEYELRSRNIQGISYMYRADTKREDYKNRLRNKKNEDYKPYCCEASYSVAGGKTVVETDGLYQGMLTNSNWMNKKKNHYLIYEEDNSAAEVKVSREQAEIYKQDLIHTKKITEGTMEIKNNFAYYDLPKPGIRKPVFYIQSDAGLIFGFTPYLRLPAVGTIYDGLPEDHQTFDDVDWTDAIFGWAGYRSKISFLDAKLEGEVNYSKAYQVVLAGPKASWYKAYIKQSEGSLNSYNTSKFKIRGRKFYWAKKELDETAIMNSTKASKESVESTIKPIQLDSIFKGSVRFENLSEKELGLLLFSLQQGDTDGKCNMGQGKPYGFGKCQLEIDDLMIEDLAKKYLSFSGPFMDHISKTVYTEKYIDEFKEYIKEVTGVKEVSELLAYQDYSTSKTEISGEHTRYLDLKDFGNIGPLKSLEEVVVGDGQTSPKETRKIEEQERKVEQERIEQETLDGLKGFAKAKYLYSSKEKDRNEEENMTQLNGVWSELEGYEAEDQHKAAVFLKEKYLELGKWEGKLSKKQAKKKEKVETLLKNS